MKTILKRTVLFYLIISLIIINSNKIALAEEVKKDYKVEAKQDLLTLVLAYGDYISDIVLEGDKIYLVMSSGKKIIYDDHKNKTYDEKLWNGTLKDSMEQVYPLEKNDQVMDENFEPGRIRVYDFLKEVYGRSKEAVEKNIKVVNTSCGSISFNKNNNAAISLKNAMNELSVVGKSNPNIYSYLVPISGTFNYRVISGTNRLSPHAFGIAIDLHSNSKDYWKWTKKEDGSKRIKSYPKEVVEVFEKNNFVWGGKWNHFDILHFEYRPEIILKSKYFGNGIKEGEKWYKNVSLDDEKIKSWVEKIDRLF